jgi:hypothetical protein
MTPDGLSNAVISRMGQAKRKGRFEEGRANRSSVEIIF